MQRIEMLREIVEKKSCSITDWIVNAFDGWNTSWTHHNTALATFSPEINLGFNQVSLELLPMRFESSQGVKARYRSLLYGLRSNGKRFSNAVAATRKNTATSEALVSTPKPVFIGLHSRGCSIAVTGLFPFTKTMINLIAIS